MTDELRQELETLTGQMKAAIQVMDESKTADGGRWQTADAERLALSEKLTAVSEKIESKEREEATAKAVADMNAFLSNQRAPSMAVTFGSGKATTSYEPGDFIASIVGAKSPDHEVQVASKAKLAEMRVSHAEAWGKATLGTTDATGGWLLPNAQVAEFIKPATFTSPYRQIMTVISGVNSPTVDQPLRLAAPARAVIALPGDTKENLGLVYNGYTATMYTLARIYDVANQFLRYSRGAAEQDILTELGTAFALGESYYVREGSGTNEPFGYTSALTNGPAAYRTAFTASATTLAGSIATALATAAGALESRGEIATAAVVTASAYWTMASQGTDTAGFFFSPAGGPLDIRPGTLMAPWGLPVYRDATADNQATAAVTDNLVVANWKKFKLYFGDSYRVDSSSEAGTRWDTNLTGFRGEEEMGFDARPAVYAGAAQLIADIIP